MAVVLLPMRTWEDGYPYLYLQAAYDLAGRRVLRIHIEHSWGRILEPVGIILGVMAAVTLLLRSASVSGQRAR